MTILGVLPRRTLQAVVPTRSASRNKAKKRLTFVAAVLLFCVRGRRGSSDFGLAALCWMRQISMFSLPLFLLPILITKVPCWRQSPPTRALTSSPTPSPFAQRARSPCRRVGAGSPHPAVRLRDATGLGGMTPPLQRATHCHFETRFPRREISRESGKRILAESTLSIAEEIEMTIPPATCTTLRARIAPDYPELV